MVSTDNWSHSTLLTRSALLFCASVAVAAMGFGAGAVETKVNVPVTEPSKSIVLDPVVFGSSAGKSSLKAAPATWSSRSNVRWNARWDINGRYLV
jgi:hypothetical protein